MVIPAVSYGVFDGAHNVCGLTTQMGEVLNPK